MGGKGGYLSRPRPNIDLDVVSAVLAVARQVVAGDVAADPVRPLAAGRGDQRVPPERYQLTAGAKPLAACG